MEAGTMSATKEQLNREKAARYLQQHPGERLRVERIARAAELTNQQASIALCSLLNGGLLPGLTRPGRGTYQWNPVGAGESPESCEGERCTYRYRGTDRNGRGRFGTWAGPKASLAARVEQWYRQGWRDLAVLTGDGPVPPRKDEEMQVAGIGRREGERRRTCWYETVRCCDCGDALTVAGVNGKRYCRVDAGHRLAAGEPVDYDDQPADGEPPRAETGCRGSGIYDCPCEADGQDGLCSCCRSGECNGSCAVPELAAAKAGEE